MIVQALWEYKSPLLQLPHVNEDNIKYFLSKKRYVKSLQQFAQLKSEDRRSILRHFSDEQYCDVMKVLGRLPLIDFQVKIEGRHFCINFPAKLNESFKLPLSLDYKIIVL